MAAEAPISVAAPSRVAVWIKDEREGESGSDTHVDERTCRTIEKEWERNHRVRLPTLWM